VTAYLTRIGTEEIDVAVSGGDELRVSVAGRERRVRVVETVPGWFAFIVDGAVHDVGVVPDAQTTAGAPGMPRRRTLVVDGHLHGVEVFRGAGARAAAGASAVAPTGGAEVRAPMPGVVVAIRAAEGDDVHVGQPLIVMEAMKMQMDVRSPARGTVRRVHVAAGGEIAGGQVLVTIE
jgi:biotin carboxyl carrier protein